VRLPDPITFTGEKMLDSIITYGSCITGGIVLLYTYTRIVIMAKTSQWKLNLFLALMCPCHTLTFWSIDQHENWRLFSKVTNKYLSHYYIDAKRVNVFRWWNAFVSDTAIL
jgi:hypothetical protein